MTPKIICFASEPAKVPGFYNKPQFNPTGNIVTGWVVIPGKAPENLVNPCEKPKPSLQELNILSDIGHKIINVLKPKEPTTPTTDIVSTDPLCNIKTDVVCLATEPVIV